MDTINEAKKCLTALGSAWRGDWSDFDGRSLRSQLDHIIGVLDGEDTYEEFCNICGIHPVDHCWLGWGDE